MSYISKEVDETVVKLLKDGGVGLMPSDTIYGLSCLALSEKAVSKLKHIKGRSQGKPFIVLIADVNMLDLLRVDKSQVSPAQKYWPGPLTFECDAVNSPLWLHEGTDYFGVRIPDSPKLLELIFRVGPITSTSANFEGGEPAKDVAAAKAIFGDNLDFYVDVGPITGSPSTLVRNHNGRLEVIRQGAVKII